METEIFTITLPPWAKGNADGDYTKVGALLPTRNGNFVGNAVLVSVLGGNNLSYQIITDAGNKTTMTLDELKECFHPPMYIVDINDCPAFWAYRHKNNIG
ncbi:MAG: hypothetical protein M0R48_10950, partial [Candidatus Omnitrophica bacterium]|nr:hypothetical protein [Candidatus Omnitrophota bacterium]